MRFFALIVLAVASAVFAAPLAEPEAYAYFLLEIGADFLRNPDPAPQRTSDLEW